jgi:hypothetical protein
MFKVNLAMRIYCNHRFDTTYDGRYVVRLPDRTQVYAEDYAKRLDGHTETPEVSRTPTKDAR